METDHWHFPRPDLAAKFIQTFEIGLTSARGIFARRRMGKTEFLEKDLIPLSIERGYMCAYTNLWDNRESPGRAIVSAITQAIQPKGLGARVGSFLRTPVKKIKASGRVPGVEGSLEDAMWD